jgi:ribosome-binding factor A
MSSRRVLKAAEAIREVVSMSILTEIQDPRVRNVTVTSVEVAPDMRSAKVHVSIMGTEAQQKTCFRGLESSAGFLQAKVAKRIDTRYTPRLQFVLDQGLKKAATISRLLNDVLPKTDDDEEEIQDELTESNNTEPDENDSDGPPN